MADTTDTEENPVFEFKRGDVFFKEGDTSSELLIIQEGVVKIFKTSDDGKQLPLGLVHAGQFVGELAFFDGKPRSATALAATQGKAIRLDKTKLEKELAKLPGWLTVLINSIAQRVREADELVKRNTIVDQKVSDEFKRW